jgi:uncharacterized protein YjiS (DUF1127 family)
MQTQAVAQTQRHSGSILMALAERIRQHRVRRQTIAELSQLDDKMLSDIGVVRGNIETIAQQISRQPAAPSPWRKLADVLAAWQAQRETTRQLSSLDDRILRDIGIERDRIPEVAEQAVAQGGFLTRALDSVTAGFGDLALQIEQVITYPFRASVVDWSNQSTYKPANQDHEERRAA